MSRVFGYLLCLFTCLIPFDHRYDKWARQFSLQLIPDQLALPIWFEKRIYVYLSDLFAVALFALAIGCFSLGPVWKKFCIGRGGVWLWGFFFLCFLSIVASPLAFYPIIYFRLLQLLTPIFLFLAVAQQGKDWVPLIHRCLVLGGIIQAIVALYQYFGQQPMGLHLLGELKNLSYAGEIPSPHGIRWLIDHWTSMCAQKQSLFRASGTFNHSNPLGAFLVISLFSTCSLYCESEKKRLVLSAVLLLLASALIVTYSRSALIGALLGGIVFFYKIKPPRSLRWTLVFSLSLCFLLFGEQMLLRGGIVNATELSTASNQVRFSQNAVALSMIQKHPVLGVGYQQFTYTPEFNSFDSKEAITMVHNTPLLIAAESGLFALLCILGFFYFVIKRGLVSKLDSSGAASLAVIIAFCWIANCDFYPFYFQHAKMLLCLMMGLTMASVSKPSLVFCADETPKVQL